MLKSLDLPKGVLNATSSMNRKGKCWDAAVMESFYVIANSEIIDNFRASPPRVHGVKPREAWGGVRV
jgi:hypothetical protein